MANSGSPIHITPEQAISEAAALGEKIARGAELFSKLRDSEVAIATTPKDEVWRQDKVTLHHYRPLADIKVATPVLIVYGLIGRYTMADLQEDRSLVRKSSQPRYRSLCRGLGQPFSRRQVAHSR